MEQAKICGVYRIDPLLSLQDLSIFMIYVRFRCYNTFYLFSPSFTFLKEGDFFQVESRRWFPVTNNGYSRTELTVDVSTVPTW